MRTRLFQFVLAELLAIAALLTAVLAGLGASMTLNGSSRHSAALSWTLVGLFGLIALGLGRVAALRFRRALSRTR